MGYIVILAVGGVIAWLASILLRDDDARSIALYVLVAELGALLAATLSGGESLLLGISAGALLAGAFGAAAFVAAAAFARMRLAR